MTAILIIEHLATSSIRQRRRYRPSSTCGQFFINVVRKEVILSDDGAEERKSLFWLLVKAFLTHLKLLRRKPFCNLLLDWIWQNGFFKLTWKSWNISLTKWTEAKLMIITLLTIVIALLSILQPKSLMIWQLSLLFVSSFNCRLRFWMAFL